MLMKHVKDINVSNSGVEKNKIVEILKKYPDLKTLDMSHNNNMNLNNITLSHDNLEKVDLSFCGVTTISEENFRSLPNLKVLILKANAIQHIDVNTFQSNRLLEFLNVDATSIDALEPTMLLQTNISKFSINQCEKYHFQPKVPFLISSTLQHFSCLGCGINTIFTETFSKTPNLQTLNLEQNAIKMFSPSIIVTNCPHLTSLNLNNNQLEEFPVQILYELQDLKELDLDYNAILSPTDNNMRLREVYLDKSYKRTVPIEDHEKWENDLDEKYSGTAKNFTTPRTLGENVTVKQEDPVNGWKIACICLAAIVAVITLFYLLKKCKVSAYIAIE